VCKYDYVYERENEYDYEFELENKRIMHYLHEQSIHCLVI
jgi:hypothetical protein